MENQITEIRSNVEEAVEEVKKLAALKRYNATHSVFGIKYVALTMVQNKTTTAIDNKKQKQHQQFKVLWEPR